MSILTDPAIARQRLIDICAPTVDPALDTSMAASVKATGSITVVSRPTDGDTLSVGSKIYSFVSGVVVGDQIQSSASNNTTAANILTKINTDTATTLCTATRNNAVLTLLANTAGVAGNSIDLESSAAHVTIVAFVGGAVAITEDDISKILDDPAVHVASIWVADTEYEIGAKVIPTANNRNGHWYELIAFDGEDVESGATEPSWPTWDNAIVTDGNLTWQEAGAERSLWDIREGAYQAWQKKIDLVSCQYDFKSGDSSDSMSQRIATLERQRDRYRPVYVI